MTLRKWPRWWALLLLAALLRLPGPDWDAGIAAHPDERFLLGVVQETPLWQDPCAAAADFSYGHLPIYLARLLVLAAPEADPLYVARLFSGLIGVLLVAVTGALARTIADDGTGFAAALLMAVAPFPIQQAHFYTVDPLVTLFASLTVLMAMRRTWSLSGIMAGLALSCKLSSVWLAFPLCFAIWTTIALQHSPFHSHISHPKPFTHHATRFLSRRFTFHVSRITFHASRHLVTSKPFRCTLFFTLITFSLASPWSVLHPVRCWRGPLIQASMAAGRYDFPYTRQYARTMPFVYPLVQMGLWGLGAGVTLVGGVALMAAVFSWRRQTFAVRVLAVWTGIYFLAMGGLYVKFPRYLLPIYPAWITWAAALPAITCTLRPRCTSHTRALRGLLWGGCLLFALPLGWAQARLHTRPHPWVLASRWLNTNVLPTDTVAVEQWDHPLPVPLDGEPQVQPVQLTLAVFDEDSPTKRELLNAAAADADVIVLASRRGYAALARQPERYAETLAWYQKLFSEREVLTFSRCPRVGPLSLTDDTLRDVRLPLSRALSTRCNTPYGLRLPRLDESFRVYDAPTVTLLLKSTPQ